MFRVSLHGRIHSHGDGVVTVHAPHQEDGYRDPVAVLLRDPSALLNPARFPEESKVWVQGDGFQHRDEAGLLRLGVYPTAVTSKTPTATSGTGAITAVAHGKISSEVTVERIDRGIRSGRWVCRFSVHVQVPEMENGLHVVLRCLMQGDEQAMYLGRQHQEGDRVNLSGDLMELRFAERGSGVPRTSHELRIRRWTYAKDPRDKTESEREVLSHRVVEQPIGEALRRNGGNRDAARGRAAPVPGYARSGGGETPG